jgi:superfamily II DNA or RNA helicase
MVATSVPKPKDITRAEKFTREAFVHAGETTEEALGPGTARRRALDAALAEIDAGAKTPSPDWRRRYSLMLGLERVLSDDEPKLADGTSLNPHQVDALSGTLTALLAEAQRNGGSAPVAFASPVLAVDDEEDFEDEEPVAVEVEDDDEDDEDDDEPEDDTPLDIEIDIGDDDEDEAEQESDEDAPEVALDEDQLDEAPDDPNAHKRFWFEHATGAGKTVAAMGFVDASRTGGILILTHRRNLVDQFHGELKDRGYAKRVRPALLRGQDDASGPVTVETYQWFVRNAGNISEAYSIVICDEAHTALGEKTSAAIRDWTGPIFIGMTATGALIARHVTDLFPTQTSRFDLAQAARRGVIAPLRGVRIPPGPGVRTIAKVPLRRGEVDTEFDQEMLAELLDQAPFNMAAADLYKTRFNGVPGVVYAAGVRHAYNLAAAFREHGLKAVAVSGETRKRELAEILARYERGEIDVLINAQLLAEGWNSPRATVCMHLAPTASKRIYQQRVGRVTRRHPGKEAGIVVDFVAPDTKNDDPVVTLHSLLDRDVYRGGAIVVGPVRRGRGRRVRVERRVLPVTSDEDRRIEVFERELWRIAVEHLPYGEQIQWAALAGARVAPSGWRRARAMLHFDRGGEFKRAFLLTAVQRNKNPQLRVRALQEIAISRDAEAFDTAIDVIGTWTRDERREGTKVMLLALAEKRIGRRDQANAWIWRLASYTREVHEEYAVQRWPETKRLLGLLVNSSGAAHARNARRLVHAARKQDRRLSAALLAAAIAHTPEGEEILRGARTRLARKPSALSRELLRNFPKSRGRRGNRRRRKKGAPEGAEGAVLAQQSARAASNGQSAGAEAGDGRAGAGSGGQRSRRSSRRSRNGRGADAGAEQAAAAALQPGEIAETGEAAEATGAAGAAGGEPPTPSRRSRSRSRKPASVPSTGDGDGVEAEQQDEPDVTKPATGRGRASTPTPPQDVGASGVPATASDKPQVEPSKPTVRRSPRSRKPAQPVDDASAVEAIADAAAALAAARAPKKPAAAVAEAAPKPRRARAVARPADAAAEEAPKPRRARAAEPPADAIEEAPKPRRARVSSRPADAAADEAPKPKRARASARTLDEATPEDGTEPKRTRAVARPVDAGADEAPKPRRARAVARPADAAADEAPKPRRVRASARPADEGTPKPRRARAVAPPADEGTPEAAPKPRRARAAAPPADAVAEDAPKPRRARAAARPADAAAEDAAKPKRARAVARTVDAPVEDTPKPRRARAAAPPADAAAEDAPKPRRTRAAARPVEETTEEAPKPRRARAAAPSAADEAATPKRRRAPTRRASTKKGDEATDAPDPAPVDDVESAA